jgi:hypothetical protein
MVTRMETGNALGNNVGGHRGYHRATNIPNAPEGGIDVRDPMIIVVSKSEGGESPPSKPT